MSHAFASRALPDYTLIAREQFWFFVSIAVRAWPISLMVIGLVVTAGMTSGGDPDLRLYVSIGLAVFIAHAAWPQQRTAGGLLYFRSLPPTHSRNTAVRAGMFWFILIATSLAAFIVIASGSDLGGRLTPLLVRESGYDGTIPFPASGPALVGATFTFLILAAGFSSTRFPGLVLQPFIWMMLLNRHLEDWAVGSALRRLFEGRYGMRTAFTGRFRPTLADGSLSNVVIEPRSWLLASAIWLAVGLTIFLFVITRRREY